MSSMIERVARAMYEVTPFKETEGGYDSQSETYRKMCEILARAAIEAMLEPTDEMIGAFHRLTDDNGSVLVTTGYRAMIEAALNHE